MRPNSVLFTASQCSMLTVNNHFVAGIIALDATLELLGIFQQRYQKPHSVA
jgi:hypothetical protein